MGSVRSSLRALFGALALLGFILFMLVGTLKIGGRKSTPSLERKGMIGREKLAVHPETGLNMSKRRVPNGPDPIHNRKAGNSRQPPGRA